jgi:protein-tyrosine kinase
MDHIRHAVDRARADSAAGSGHASDILDNAPTQGAIPEIPLNRGYLQSKRIISFDGMDNRARAFDLLRTQMLRTMDAKGWQFVGITSPTAASGKTVTATNLALSMARLTDRSVLLVDMDMHKPKVAEYLGVKTGTGLLSVLEGRVPLTKAVFQACTGRHKFMVLPGEVCHSGISEWMMSQSMSTLMQAIKREFRSRVVIFDLPPVLIGDEVISIAPLLDCIVMITAVGSTTIADIKECSKHLHSTPILRTVVNKVTEPIVGYYGYGY